MYKYSRLYKTGDGTHILNTPTVFKQTKNHHSILPKIGSQRRCTGYRGVVCCQERAWQRPSGDRCAPNITLLSVLQYSTFHASLLLSFQSHAMRGGKHVKRTLTITKHYDSSYCLVITK